MATAETRIEYVDVSTILQWPGNPKSHDIESMKASIRRFGFVAPAVIDESTGRIVAGHGRVRALGEMWYDGEDVPTAIRPHDGGWLMPVLRGASFSSEQEAQAYLIADNRLAEIGGWDDEALAEMLASLSEDVEIIGYTDKELAKLLKSSEPGESFGSEPSTSTDDPEDDQGGTPKSTNIKVVQLYLDQDAYDEFTTKITAIAEHHDETNITDTVFRLVDDAYKLLK